MFSAHRAEFRGGWGITWRQTRGVSRSFGCLGRWRPQRSVPTSGRVGMITGFLNDDFEVPGMVEGFFRWILCVIVIFLCHCDT